MDEIREGLGDVDHRKRIIRNCHFGDAVSKTCPTALSHIAKVLFQKFHSNSEEYVIQSIHFVSGCETFLEFQRKFALNFLNFQ